MKSAPQFPPHISHLTPAPTAKTEVFSKALLRMASVVSSGNSAICIVVCPCTVMNWHAPALLGDDPARDEDFASGSDAGDLLSHD